MSLLIDLQPSAGPALVVGGGRIALRKVRNLLDGGFRVTVVAPEVCAELRGLPGLAIEQRPFEDADIERGERWALVFACTNARAVNRRIGELARSRGILSVVTDAREESTFFTPATARNGGVTVAISTGGASPAQAKALRDRVVAALGEDWGSNLEPAAAVGNEGDA